MPNWSDILTEIASEAQRHRADAQAAVDHIRRRYLEQLFAHTGRNVIAYYSGFLSKPSISGIDIVDEDKNGLMMAIHGMNRALGLDLLLHTPGGSVAAAETMVDYLRRMFGRDVRAVVPQIAMSAGTMIACCCKSIIMGKHSNLGPVDPQLSGVPAAGVLTEFQKAYEEIKADQTKVLVWQHIIRQYPPSFLGQCENAVRWAKEFVQSGLENNMLDGVADKASVARRIVTSLTEFSDIRAHDRHIHFDECVALGLKVEPLEADSALQDLVLTVHHCYMHTLMNTASFKIIENHFGTAFVKQQIPVAAPLALQAGLPF